MACMDLLRTPAVFIPRLAAAYDHQFVEIRMAVPFVRRGFIVEHLDTQRKRSMPELLPAVKFTDMGAFLSHFSCLHSFLDRLGYNNDNLFMQNLFFVI